MREIKFRAWDKHEHKMIKPKGIPTFCMSESDLWILMQFTGLKDKSGKEIYEGNVIEGKRGNKKYVGSVRYSNDYLDYRVYTYPEHCFFRLSEFHPIEVIGNIYENPGLIREEK